MTRGDAERAMDGARSAIRSGGWQAVEAALSGEIRDGLLAPGSRLPAEPALMVRFGVGRHSVRRAVEALEARGLVRARQGSGTYVRPATLLDYRLSERTRFSENLLGQGREPSGEILSVSRGAPPPEVAEALRLPEGEETWRFVSLGLADGVPVSLSDSHHPARRFPDLPAARARHGGLTAALAALGVGDYRRVLSVVTARPPAAEEAARLDQSPAQPVLVVRKLDADLAGVPVSWSETLWAAERVRLSVVAPPGGEGA